MTPLTRLRDSVARHPYIIIVVYCELVVAGVIASSPLFAQTTWRFTGCVLIIDVAAAIAFTWRALSDTRVEATAPSRYLICLDRVGVGLTSLVLLGAGWAVWLRSRREERDVATGLLVALAAFAVLLWWASGVSRSARGVSWVRLGAGLILVPPLLGWVVGSVSWALVFGRSPRPLTELRGTSGLRHAARCTDGWAVQGRRVPIALTLSGGGYRAAVAHAGLVVALEEQCVPLRYLSTVSGGSIFGASYALGVPPRKFVQHLLTPPGLGNDLMSFRAIATEWLWPRSGSADTYARHFERVFFGDLRLRDLGEDPLLLINTTDLERHEPHVREALFKGRSPTTDRSVSVAEAVAASAAFPGAFEPKRLQWPRYGAPIGTAAVTRRTFVDGGVVDNLGIEGLRYFLALRHEDGTPTGPNPALLLISDASQYPAGTDFPTVKVGPLTNLTRSLTMSWAALHRHLYFRMSGVDAFGVPGMIGYAPARTVFGAPTATAGELLTIMLPTTSPIAPVVIQGCAFATPGDSNRVARDVSEYDTLMELDREQVLKAFWLGYVVGLRYGRLIEAVRHYLTEAPSRIPEATVQARGQLNAVADSLVRETGPCVTRTEVLGLIGERAVQ